MISIPREPAELSSDGAVGFGEVVESSVHFLLGLSHLLPAEHACLPERADVFEMRLGLGLH
jgi:hypothetical protein